MNHAFDAIIERLTAERDWLLAKGDECPEKYLEGLPNLCPGSCMQCRRDILASMTTEELRKDIDE